MYLKYHKVKYHKVKYHKVKKEIKNKKVYHKYIKRFVSKALYGTLIVTSLIVAMENQGQSAGKVITNLIATIGVLALGQFYSDAVAERMVSKEKLTKKKLKILFYEIAPISIGSHIPTIIFFFALFGLITVKRAFFFAKIIGLITLFVYGYLIGKYTNKSKVRCFLNGVINVLIGGTVIIIKVLVN